MANPRQNDALSTLREKLAAHRRDPRLILAPALKDTLDALDSAMCEQARRQRSLANAIAVIAAKLDDKQLPQGVLGPELTRAVFDVFYAGDIS